MSVVGGKAEVDFERHRHHQPPGYGLLGSHHAGVQKRPLCWAAGGLVEIPRQGGGTFAGRCGVLREEKSDVVVFVSSGKTQHDGHDASWSINAEIPPRIMGRSAG